MHAACLVSDSARLYSCILRVVVVDSRLNLHVLMVWLRQWKFCGFTFELRTKKAFVTSNRVCSYED